MFNYGDKLKKNLNAAIQDLENYLSSPSELKSFERAVDKIIEGYKKGGRLYIAGNGGSAADAQHLAAEFVSKYSRDRAPLAAESLSVDPSVVTAIGNDYGYQYVFSRQLECKLTKHDLFLGISTSGNSENIVEAFRQCRKMGVSSILLSNRTGGKCAALADIAILVPGESTGAIQQMHLLTYHSLCESVEAALFSDETLSVKRRFVG